MPTIIVSLNWRDQGIRAIKDGAKRAKAAREMAKKLGIDLKEIYLTTGDSDLLAILDTPNGDNVAKFALALSAGGKCAYTHLPSVAAGRISKAVSRASVTDLLRKLGCSIERSNGGRLMATFHWVQTS